MRRLGARWKRRALVELGFVEPAEVALAPLSADASGDAGETWRIVGELLKLLRLTETPGEPFAFSAPWDAKAYGSDANAVRRRKWWLQQERYLLRVGEQRSRHGNPTVLWRAREQGDET